MISFGFDHEREGALIPNGVAPDVWQGLAGVDLENAVEGVHFRLSRLPQFLAKAKFQVQCDTVSRLIGSPYHWFYMLRPYAVPELEEAFGNVPAEARREMESGKCHLLIDYSHEGFSEWMFHRVYEALGCIPLPRERIVLLSGDLNVEGGHARYVSRHRIDGPITVYALNYFKNDVAAYMSSDESRNARLRWRQVESRLSRSKLYLSLNRRNRLHRIVTAVQLERRGLLDLGYVSLEDQFGGRTNQEAFEEEGNRFGVSENLMREVRAGYPQLHALLPLHVDVNEMKTNHAHTHVAWPYLESWLSLVSETLFFESAPGQIFFSEKIWKPMMNLHPFLLIGDANSLATLRSLGFQTFHPHIDETYDGILDHEKRLEMVLDELERLSRINEPQRRHWLMGMKDILIHNFEELAASSPSEIFRTSVGLWRANEDTEPVMQADSTNNAG